MVDRSWSVTLDHRRRRATIDLPFDAIEFIGMELPRGDGFTREWWEFVWKPLIEEDDDADSSAV